MDINFNSMDGSSYLLAQILDIEYTYSRVHKSSDSFFSKILEKPSIVQKKIIPHINGFFEAAILNLFFQKKKNCFASSNEKRQPIHIRGVIRGKAAKHLP